MDKCILLKMEEIAQSYVNLQLAAITLSEVKEDLCADISNLDYVIDTIERLAKEKMDKLNDITKKEV